MRWPFRRPTFGAIVGVKDEADLIGPCLMHLKAIGVTEIVVVDAGSTDGTLARALRDLGVTVLERESWVRDYPTESMSLTTLTWGALTTDFVFLLDADEFPIPRKGHLKHSRFKADVISIPRYNTVSDVEDLLAEPLEAWLLNGPPESRELVEAGRPIVTLRPQPKALARRSVIQGVAPGGHDVVTDDTATRAEATDLLIAHVAISSWPRFATKVDNIRAEMAKHPGFFTEDYAWHWRRWAAFNETELTAEFLENEPSAENRARWLAQGLIKQGVGETVYLPVRAR